MAPAADAIEFFRIESVDADIEALESSFGKGLCQFFEQDTIGGHRYFANAGQAGNAAHDFYHIFTHSRFATGQSEFVEAQLGE